MFSRRLHHLHQPAETCFGFTGSQDSPRGQNIRKTGVIQSTEASPSSIRKLNNKHSSNELMNLLRGAT